MLGPRSVLFQLIAPLIAAGWLISAGQANAQSKQDKLKIALEISTKIKLAIKTRRGGVYLQEKAMRRISECGFLYGIMAKEVPDQQSKDGAALAAEISLEILPLISDGIHMDRFKQIVTEAKDSILQMPKRRDQKELLLLLRNCKSFHDLNEIDDALAELAL